MSEEDTSPDPQKRNIDGDPPSEVESLRRQLEELRAQAKEQEDRFLRARAELENQRKRGARENEDARKYALQSFVQELLPVKDSLEKGLEAVSTDAGEEAKALRQGIQLTLRLWGEALGRAGVEEIDPLGQPFNPDLHEALSIRRSPSTASNTVLEVAQKGYLLNGRLVRAARVIVAAGEGGAGTP